jgi:hypothetical protein
MGASQNFAGCVGRVGRTTRLGHWDGTYHYEERGKRVSNLLRLLKEQEDEEEVEV